MDFHKKKHPQENPSVMPTLGTWIYKEYMWSDPLMSLIKKPTLKELIVHFS